MEDKNFDCWCLIELFGHQKIAGKCTEQNIAGTNMLRVDVPPIEGIPAFTRFLNHAAIYAINPITEELALILAKRIQAAPVTVYDVSELVNEAARKLTERMTSKQLSEGEGEDDPDEADADKGDLDF